MRRATRSRISGNNAKAQAVIDPAPKRAGFFQLVQEPVVMQNWTFVESLGQRVADRVMVIGPITFCDTGDA